MYSCIISICVYFNRKSPSSTIKVCSQLAILELAMTKGLRSKHQLCKINVDVYLPSTTNS